MRGCKVRAELGRHGKADRRGESLIDAHLRHHDHLRHQSSHRPSLSSSLSSSIFNIKCMHRYHHHQSHQHRRQRLWHDRATEWSPASPSILCSTCFHMNSPGITGWKRSEGEQSQFHRNVAKHERNEPRQSLSSSSYCSRDSRHTYSWQHRHRIDIAPTKNKREPDNKVGELATCKTRIKTMLTSLVRLKQHTHQRPSHQRHHHHHPHRYHRQQLEAFPYYHLGGKILAEMLQGRGKETNSEMKMR